MTTTQEADRAYRETSLHMTNVSVAEDVNPADITRRSTQQQAAHMAEKLRRAAAPMSDSVDHPAHYTSHPSGVECIQITEHMNFNMGNAVKYMWRADHKGSLIPDLEKAVWYIKREIARIKGMET